MVAFAIDDGQLQCHANNFATLAFSKSRDHLEHKTGRQTDSPESKAGIHIGAELLRLCLTSVSSNNVFRRRIEPKSVLTS